MRTLIAYATKYGGTAVCAKEIARSLPGQADLLMLDKDSTADLSAYDLVIVGTSIYVSKPRKEAAAFVARHHEALLQKKLGLFLCCIQDMENSVAQQFAAAFPQALRTHATAMEALGGVVDYTKLKKMDAFIMNMVAGDLRKKSGAEIVSTLSNERMERFVRALMG